MKIKITTLHVNDQDKALRFYTDVLGFVKKTDFSKGTFRWLTVASPDEENGVELQLALADDPAVQTYQRARYEQGQPAMMFDVDDMQKEYDRMKPLGANFTQPPTSVTGSTIAKLDDGCGNIVQLTKLDW